MPRPRPHIGGIGNVRQVTGEVFMHGRISSDEIQATEVVAGIGEEDRQIWPKTWFANLINELWPVKGAIAVTQYSGIPDRTARNYQSGHSEPPASVLRDLLRGNEGYRVLTWVMAGFTPTWWLVVQHERAVYARLKDLSPTLRQIVDECA